MSSSRASTSGRSKGERVSIAPPSPGAVETQYTRGDGVEYPSWWTRERLVSCFCSLPEDTVWISYICILALSVIVLVAIRATGPHYEILDALHNISYGVHVLGIGYNLFADVERPNVNVKTLLGFLLDLATYSHYVSGQPDFKLICYYIRLHRPFRYLWELNDYNLKGSVLGTTLKYWYISLALRITWALIWSNMDQLEQTFGDVLNADRYSNATPYDSEPTDDSLKSAQDRFIAALNNVNKMFIPIGPSVAPGNDVERVLCMLVMLTGCLEVTGAAVASLSLVISLYMRPEEQFRTRYKLIMKEMSDTHLPARQRERVETFYKMYWHKQRAVSRTRLLPTFPPTLPATVYNDIYFEATQKTRILRDLSNHFLCELAKKMLTIHYIPGDAIIKRSSKKSSIIYITYGDVEIVTAEDDITAVLRMTRGTVLGGCAVHVPAHLEVRAATFCTAHVLHTADMWRVAAKHGSIDDQALIISAAIYEHLEKVRFHYLTKIPETVKYKTSLFYFKQSLKLLREKRDAKGRLIMAEPDVMLEIAGSYNMRNFSDASLTDEADAICLRSTFPCILQPDSSLQMAWSYLVAIVILTVCFTHPYYLVFRKTVPLEFRFFDYVVTVIYTLDLIVHLSTGANVEEGVPITFSQTSSQQMRSHWFVLDVVGTLPILEFVGDGHFAGLNKLLRLPKIFRVLQTVEETCVYQRNVIRFLTYTLLLVMACYMITTIQQAFMCFEFGYCQVSNFTHRPYWAFEPLDDVAVENRLSFGLYWAASMITFTCHMPTWGLDNLKNVLYTLALLELCIVLRIFMEAVYSATIMVTTALREDYDACIETVKNFFIRNQIDPVLRERFITYIQLSWYTDKAYSMTNKKSSIFYDLPSHVNQDIVTRQRSKYIQKIPFMQFVDKEDVSILSSKARLFYTSPNEILLNTGDMTNEMYVIKRGICEVYCPSTRRVVKTLGPKHHFGVVNCILRLPAYYTVKAVTHVQIFSLSRKHLLKTLEMPRIKDAIEYSKELPEYLRLLHHREPFLSYSPPDRPPNMERFPLPRKHEPDTAFLQPFYKLGFLSVLRYTLPRFTLRPDGRYVTVYECVRALCAFSSAMLFPSYSYLVLQWEALYYVAFVLDAAAYFDVVQRMLVGYFNDQGVLVYHPVSTASHYLKGAFIVDLVGCLALENLESSTKESFGDMYRVTQMTQILMLNRIIQLYRIPSAMVLLGKYIERRDIMIVLKATPIFLTMLNVLTCLMVFNSVNVYYSLHTKDWLIVPIEDPGGSWLNLFNKAFRYNMTESPWNLHLSCYFWVVYEATTTGYNSLHPSNLDLIWLLFIGLVVCTMITTYYSVRIISVRANVNQALASFQEHMRDMKVFMKREKLSPELTKEVLDYYEYNWDKMGGVDYMNVLKLCDQITLRTDTILHIFGPTFAKCRILSHCDVSLLRIMGRAVRRVHFLRGSRLVEADDVIADMYILDYGDVEVKEVTSVGTNVFTMYRGSVFGNLEGSPYVRCPVTFTTTSRAQLLMINSKVFHQIIKDFPAVLKLLKENQSEDNKNYILGNLTDALKIKKERSLSSPILFRKRKGLVKYLYFKDKLVQMYLIAISLVCVYCDMYNAGFQDNRTGLIFTLYALDMGFYVKILMQYMLPHIVVNTESARNVLLPMRSQYFKGEFKYDVLSCIPLELFSLLDTKHRWRTFSLLRMNRMFRIVTVYKCLLKVQERMTGNLSLITIASVLVWFTLFVHATTCLWYFIAVLEDTYEPGTSWLYADNGDSMCHNTYTCSVYFILTTFTQNGVGDIMPKKQSEVVFVSILQIVSTMLYMVYVGEFSNIIQYQSFRSFNFYSTYLELQEFLHNNRVSRNLVGVVNEYCVALWRESRGRQEPRFLRSAPHSLRLRVMAAAYLNHLTRHHVFEHCEAAFLRQLVGCLKLYTYNKDMYVVKENEITDSMYFIHTGRVQESSEARDGSARIYTAGTCFGVSQGLAKDTPYLHSYRTLTKSQVLTLNYNDWEYLLKHCPSAMDTINKHTKGSDDKDNKDHDFFPKFKQRPSFKRTDRGTTSSPPSDKEKLTRFNVPDIEPTETPEFSDIGKWPTDSRGSTEKSSEDLTETQNEVELKDLSILTPSTSSLSDSSQNRRKVQYAEGVRRSSSALINKIASAARKLMRKRDEVDLEPTDDTASKDNLLLQEEEEAALALIKEIDDNERKETKNEPKAKTDDDIINVDKTERHMGTINITQSHDIPKADEARLDQPKSDTSIHSESENKAVELTSSSKSNKRFTKVRYEDEELNEDEPSTSKTKELTAEQRNMRTLDSDTHLNLKPETDEDVEEESSDSGSATSLKRRYTRPSTF